MPALDHDAVRERAAAAAAGRFPGARLDELRRFPGGLSSVTFASVLHHDAGELDVVLKVAPPGLEPRANRDVLRQARVLDALAPVPGFGVPAVLFRDAGDPPATPPLFGMELAAGQAYEPMIDVADDPPTAEVAAGRMRVAARALARLHDRPPADLGLGDVEVTTPDAERSRWTRLLATIDADIAPGHEDLARRLADRAPAPLAPRVHHGDYRLANMLFAGEELRAVVDWEIWSVGDPRWDLTWLAMHTAPVHRFHDRRPAADEAAASLVPTGDELVELYVTARDSGEALTEDLDWFRAAAQYKGVSVVAALYKRGRRLPDPDPTLMTAGAQLDRLLAAGHEALDRRP